MNIKNHILLIGVVVFFVFSCKNKLEVAPLVLESPLDKSIKNGLTAYYSLNGDWKDESLNGNNALVSSGNFVNDRNGKPLSALAWGDTDRNPAEIPGSLMKKGGTYCFWFFKSDTIKTFSIWKNQFTRPEKIAGITLNATYGINIISGGGNKFLLFDYLVGFSPGISVVVPFTPNKWEFFVVSVIDATSSYPFATFKIYKNGLLSYKKDVDSFSVSAVETTVPIRLGGGTSSSNNSKVEGKLDDVGIWSRVLTDDEIVGLYLRK